VFLPQASSQAGEQREVAVGGGGGGAKGSGRVVKTQGLLADFRKPQSPRIDEAWLIRGPQC